GRGFTGARSRSDRLRGRRPVGRPQSSSPRQGATNEGQPRRRRGPSCPAGERRRVVSGQGRSGAGNADAVSDPLALVRGRIRIVSAGPSRRLAEDESNLAAGGGGHSRAGSDREHDGVKDEQHGGQRGKRTAFGTKRGEQARVRSSGRRRGRIVPHL